VIHPDLPAFLSYLDSLEGTTMTKTTTDTNIAELTAEIARILDQRATRPFDGHIVIDTVSTSQGAVGGRVLAAHDQAEVLKFSLALAL
jgi:hypothetical protein